MPETTGTPAVAAETAEDAELTGALAADLEYDGVPAVSSAVAAGAVKRELSALDRVRDISQRNEQRWAEETGETVTAEPRPGPVTDVATVPAGLVTGTTRRDRIDGAELLTYTRAFLRYFAVFPNPETEIMLTAWIAAAHGRDENSLPIYPYAPRVALLSPKPGGGKSWVMRIMAKLVPDGKRLIEPSEAYVARTIGYQHKTVFLDEADILFGTGKRKQALRAIINGGYEPDGEWGRASGSGTTTTDIPTFGFMGLAALDVMRTGTGDHLNATLDRCLFGYMRKAPEGYRPPRFDARAAVAAEALRERLALFMAQEIADGAADDIPDLGGLGNRPAALWEPLAMVCDRAGGEWPGLIREACETLESAKGLPYQNPDEWASCRSVIDGYLGLGSGDDRDYLD